MEPRKGCFVIARSKSMRCLRMPSVSARCPATCSSGVGITTPVSRLPIRSTPPDRIMGPSAYDVAVPTRAQEGICGRRFVMTFRRTPCFSTRASVSLAVQASFETLSIGSGLSVDHHQCVTPFRAARAPRELPATRASQPLHLARPRRALAQVVEHLAGFRDEEDAFVFAVGVVFHADRRGVAVA